MNRLPLATLTFLALLSGFSFAGNLDKSARVRKGTISIQVDRMLVSAPFLEQSTAMDGQRVYPKIEGALKLVNSINGSANKISASTGDGVLGDLGLGGLYFLYRKNNVLYARFIADVMEGIDHAVEVGTISETSEVKLAEGFRVVAQISQHEATSLARWAGNDWDHERLRIYIDGLRAAHHKQYGHVVPAAPGNIDLKR